MKRLLLCTLLLIAAGCGRDPDAPQWRLTGWKNVEYDNYEATPVGVKGITKNGRPFEYEGQIIHTGRGDRNLIGIRYCTDDNPKYRQRSRTEFIITWSGK